MDKQNLAKLAAPAVVSLVAFLSYSSQYLFGSIEPGPLESRESRVFNTLVACIWVCYARACTTNPGRVPIDWQPDEAENADTVSPPRKAVPRQRYCRKCEATKPPRSHHCRICKRYAVSSQRVHLADCQDVSRKWTITVHGPSTVYPIPRYLISSAFCGTQYLP